MAVNFAQAVIKINQQQSSTTGIQNVKNVAMNVIGRDFPIEVAGMIFIKCL